MRHRVSARLEMKDCQEVCLAGGAESENLKRAKKIINLFCALRFVFFAPLRETQSFKIKARKLKSKTARNRNTPQSDNARTKALADDRAHARDE